MASERETLREIERLLEGAASCAPSARIIAIQSELGGALSHVRALLAKPEPTPIRGRWTPEEPRTYYCAGVVEQGGPGYPVRVVLGAAFDRFRNKVVPVPDEQAIERAARTAWDRDEARAASEDARSVRYRARPWTEAHELDRVEYLEDARAVLAAALEQPDERTQAEHGFHVRVEVECVDPEELLICHASNPDTVRGLLELALTKPDLIEFRVTRMPGLDA